MQSHHGELNLLPALPKQWPKGSVNGLRARGGYGVDIAWDEGKLSAATVRSSVAGTCRVRCGDVVGQFEAPAGAVTTCRVGPSGFTFERK